VPSVNTMEAKGNVKGLVKALQSKDHSTRRVAAAALGRIGDARAIEPGDAEAVAALAESWIRETITEWRRPRPSTS